MKYLHNIKLFAIISVSVLAFTACTDTWDDHYDNQNSSNENLWTVISQDENLSNFVKVVKTCGYDVPLNGSQMFSVFAPDNSALSSERADSLIDEYNKEKNQNISEDDNEVIKQFLCNHIALYNKSVASTTNDTIRMVNGKYIPLSSGSFGTCGLISKNILTKNGVLYTINNVETYYPNVFESLKKTVGLDSVSNYLYSFNRYVFDEENSVAGGINENGQTVYLDSVTDLTNNLLSSYGHLDREDSLYWYIAPTNKVWNELYAKYNPYFNYDNTVENRDSLNRYYTCSAILEGSFFNKNMNSDVSLRDSACSTEYNFKLDDYGMENTYFKFYKPYDDGGIFTGTENVTCSNGVLMKSDNWKISPYLTFLQQTKLEAEYTNYQDTIQNAISPVSVRRVSSDNPFYGKVSNNEFIELNPSKNGQPTIRYNIPNIFSNIGYDIFVVFAPATAYNTEASAEQRLPSKVRFYTIYNEQNGRAVSQKSIKIGSGYIYTTNPDILDTVQVASNYVYPTCSYGLEDPQVKLIIRNTSTTNETDKFSRYTRIDCVIFKPHEDK